MEYTQRVWIMYTIMFSLNFLIVWATNLNQHMCFQGILTSKFVSKDKLLWKRGSSFVSTDDENLYNPSKLMWFDGPKPSEMSPRTPPKNSLPNQKQEAV